MAAFAWINVHGIFIHIIFVWTKLCKLHQKVCEDKSCRSITKPWDFSVYNRFFCVQQWSIFWARNLIWISYIPFEEVCNNDVYLLFFRDRPGIWISYDNRIFRPFKYFTQKKNVLVHSRYFVPVNKYQVMSIPHTRHKDQSSNTVYLFWVWKDLEN